jgi:hypothetical protein
VPVIEYILDQVKLQEKPLPEINYLDAIINNSHGFISDMTQKDLLLEKLLAVKVVYFSETVGRTQTTISPGRSWKFPCLRVKMEDGDSPAAYAQLRGIFKTVYSQSEVMHDLVFLVRCVSVRKTLSMSEIWVYVRPSRTVKSVTSVTNEFLVVVHRWLVLCPEEDWDGTGQPLLQWEKAPEEERIPGAGDAFFQFIDASTTLEAVTLLPKPFTDALLSDDGDINHPDRQMWLHTVGQSALGET